jgi:uncharacterized membrane protein
MLSPGVTHVKLTWIAAALQLCAVSYVVKKHCYEYAGEATVRCSGCFCYATFELTSLSLLKRWTWAVVAVDVSWGTFVTALSATVGLVIANRLASKV